MVTLYGISDIATMPDPRFAEKLGLLGTESNVSTSPLSQVREHAPPFLFIHGDKDEAVPIQQSIVLMEALRKAGDQAELITIPNGPHATSTWHTLPGVPDWERAMTLWLNRTLNHSGPVGEGIRARPAVKP